jgi:hypothetical protein
MFMGCYCLSASYLLLPLPEARASDVSGRNGAFVVILGVWLGARMGQVCAAV